MNSEKEIVERLGRIADALEKHNTILEGLSVFLIRDSTLPQSRRVDSDGNVKTKQILKVTDLENETKYFHENIAI